MPVALEAARHILLLALAIVCVYTDLARHRIYNAATLSGLAGGLVLAYLLDATVAGQPHLKAAALAALLGGGILFAVYLAGGLGAGDVKLMAAVGALSPLGGATDGWRFVCLALMYTAIVGAAIAVGTLIWKGRLLEGLRDSARTLFTFRRGRKTDGEKPLTVPYGLAIGVGTLWAWLEAMVF